MTLPLAAPILDAAAVVALCEFAGYRVLSRDTDAVTADRPIAGHPHHVRAVVFQQLLPGIWHGSVCHRWPTAAEPLTYRTIVLAQSDHLTTGDELGLWLGGQSSVPIDRREVDAILSGEAA